MMKHLDTALNVARPAVLGVALLAGSANAAAAQDASGAQNGYNTFDPAYNTVDSWQAAWDGDSYDHHHVLVGTIANFKPYRMLLQQAGPDGHPTSVDLKDGTVIRPDGTELAPGMHVAVMGYWSKGTFIANRVVLRGS